MWIWGGDKVNSRMYGDALQTPAQFKVMVRCNQQRPLKVLFAKVSVAWFLLSIFFLCQKSQNLSRIRTGTCCKWKAGKVNFFFLFFFIMNKWINITSPFQLKPLIFLFLVVYPTNYRGMSTCFFPISCCYKDILIVRATRQVAKYRTIYTRIHQKEKQQKRNSRNSSIYIFA